MTLSSWPQSGGCAEETGQIKLGGWAHDSLSSSEEKPAGSSHSKCGGSDLAVGSPGESEAGEVPQGCSRALQSMSKDLKHRHSSGISQKPVGNLCLCSHVSTLHVQTYVRLLKKYYIVLPSKLVSFLNMCMLNSF